MRTITEQRGPAWTDYVIAVVTECPYAAARDLQEMDGAIAILRSYKRLLDESIARFPFPKRVLADCHHGWPDSYATIREQGRSASLRTTKRSRGA